MTGSYNLSANAEFETLENVVVLRGATYAGVVQRFVDNFDALWETGRAEGLYEGSEHQARHPATVTDGRLCTRRGTDSRYN